MYIIYCDGSFRENPYCITVGVYILNKINKEKYRFYDLISLDRYLDNNTAEFMAVFCALEKIKVMEIHNEAITLNTDSRTIINMLNYYGNYKEKSLKKLCSKLRKKLMVYPNLEIRWVSRDENRLAHNLSKQAIKQYMREKYIDEVQIIDMDNRQYKVLSSQGNKFYIVDLENYKCTCKYHKFEKYSVTAKCKHIEAVERMLKRAIE